MISRLTDITLNAECCRRISWRYYLWIRNELGRITDIIRARSSVSRLRHVSPFKNGGKSRECIYALHLRPGEPYAMRKSAQALPGHQCRSHARSLFRASARSLSQFSNRVYIVVVVVIRR